MNEPDLDASRPTPAQGTPPLLRATKVVPPDTPPDRGALALRDQPTRPRRAPADAPPLDRLAPGSLVPKRPPAARRPSRDQYEEADPPAYVPSGPAHFRPSRRPGRGREVAIVLLVAIVVALGAAGGIYELAGKATRHAIKEATATTAAPTTSAPATTPPTTVAPPPTTAGPPFKLVSNVSGTATYTVPASATVTLHATGPCWVEANKATAAGATVYTATMAAGQSEPLTAPVWIRLGAPAYMTMTVNGTALPLPPTGGSTLDIEFQ